MSSHYKVPHLIVPEERSVITPVAKTDLILVGKNIFNLLSEFEAATIKISVKSALWK